MGASLDFIRTALQEADANALRIALLQTTGDPDLEAMPIELLSLRGGSLRIPRLAASDEEIVRAKALDFLADPDHRGPRSDVPSAERTRHLMETFEGRPLSDREFAAYRDEVALEEVPRQPRWTAEPPPSLNDFRVLIIGAGASGIAMSVKLHRLGIDHVVLERLDDLSGTWHRHRYPNVRVDTSFLQYQFKFEKRYVFEDYFPPQSAIKDYISQIAAKYEVGRRTVFDQEVVDAAWDEDRALWTVVARNSSGATTTYEANVVVTATGLFSTPKMPAFPGLATFAGTVVHTSDWDPEIDWSGRRVAVIGNGSTGTQILPKLAETAGHVTAFQRTPGWIAEVPTLRNKVSEHTRWLISEMPYYWNWASYAQFVATLGMQRAQVIDPEWQARGGQISEINDSVRASLTDYIASKVGHDPELMAKLVPTYAPLARRLIVDSGWYDALVRDNVDLNTDGIASIVPEGIITGAGDVIELDLIVVSAGFEVSRYFFPAEFRGRDGSTFEELWGKDGARAHLGMAIPGFPNLYTVYGPNSQGRGGGGFLMYVDLWTQYVAEMLVAQIEGGHRIAEVSREAFDRYNEEIDDAIRGLIYESEGQGGYYVNEHGRSGVQMPWDIDEYHERLLPARTCDYDLR